MFVCVLSDWNFSSIISVTLPPNNCHWYYVFFLCACFFFVFVCRCLFCRCHPITNVEVTNHKQKHLQKQLSPKSRKFVLQFNPVGKGRFFVSLGKMWRESLALIKKGKEGRECVCVSLVGKRTDKKEGNVVLFFSIKKGKDGTPGFRL